MAFLGSLGRVFGITTPEAGRIGAAFATGGLGQAALTTLQSLGDQPATRTAVPVDVSAPPAGVDSLATLSKASQTSRTFGTASEFDGRMLGGPGIVGTWVPEKKKPKFLILPLD